MSRYLRYGTPQAAQVTTGRVKVILPPVAAAGTSWSLAGGAASTSSTSGAVVASLSFTGGAASTSTTAGDISSGTVILNTFDQPNGTALTSSATVTNYVTHAGSPVASTDHPQNGITGAKYPAVSGAGCLHRIAFDVATSKQATVEANGFIPPTPASSEILMTFRYASGSVARLTHASGTGALVLQDAVGTNLFVSSSSYSSTSVRVLIWITADTATTGTGFIAIYLGDSTTAAESSSVSAVNFGTNNLVSIDIGRITTAAYAYTPYFDSIRMQANRNAAFGPYLPGALDTQALGYIGDSLTSDSSPGGAVETAEAAVGWIASKIRIDGLVSRSISGTGALPSAPQVVTNWRAAGFNPTNWIIALGTNGSSDPEASQEAYMNTLLDTIVAGTTGVHRVWWVGVAYQNGADTRAATFVTAMNAVAAARTDVQMIPIDYNAILHNGRDETGFWASDPHMTSTGYAVRNQIIAAATAPNPLVGAAASTSTTTGAQVARLAFTGSVVSASGTAGAVTATLKPTGAAAASGSLTTGTLAASLPAAGGAASVSSTAGALGISTGATAWPLTGGAASASLTTAAVVMVSPLTGAAASASLTTGAVVATLAPSGSAASVSTTGGTLAGKLAAAGAAASVSTTTGAVTEVSPLTGSVTSASTTTGALGTAFTLTAAVSSVSTTTSAIGLQSGPISWPLSGSAASTSTTGAAMVARLAAAGAAVSTTVTSGLLAASLPAAGGAASTSLTTGALAGSLPAAGAAASVSTTTGAVGLTSGAVQWPLTGSAASTSTTTAAQVARLALAGAAVSLSTTNGAVVASAVLTGSAGSVTLTTAGLGQGLKLAGSAAAISTTGGALGLGARLTLTGAVLSLSTTTGSIVLNAPLTASPGYTGRVTLTGWSGRAVRVLEWQGATDHGWAGRANGATLGQVKSNRWTGRATR